MQKHSGCYLLMINTSSYPINSEDAGISKNCLNNKPDTMTYRRLGSFKTTSSELLIQQWV